MLIKKNHETFIAQPGDFGSMCRLLLHKIPPDRRIASLIFFGDPFDNFEYRAHWNIINEIIGTLFKSAVPPFTYIAQKPLTGGLLLEACLIEKVTGQKVIYNQHADTRYTIIQTGSGKELIIGGVPSGEKYTGVFQQADAVFDKIGAIFKKEDMPLDSIVRQWNYIENITSFSSGGQNYQEFNRARSNFYARTSWENGYPAATGIGTRAGGVIVQMEALLCSDPSIRNIVINNNLQIPAHKYSCQVLAGSEEAPATPKFERARLTGSEEEAVVHVSGTAAIRGEESMAGGDVVEQTRITMENICHLISGDNLRSYGYDFNENKEFRSVIVYIKNESDYKNVKRFMDQKYPATNPVYLVADLCRDELLVEIEAVVALCRNGSCSGRSEDFK